MVLQAFACAESPCCRYSHGRKTKLAGRPLGSVVLLRLLLLKPANVLAPVDGSQKFPARGGPVALGSIRHPEFRRPCVSPSITSALARFETEPHQPVGLKLFWKAERAFPMAVASS